MRRKKRRKYRAIIIDLRRISRFFVLSLIFAICFSSLFFMKNKNSIDISQKIKNVLSFFIGFEPWDFSSVLESEFALKISDENGEDVESVYNPEGVDVRDTSPSPTVKEGKHNIKEIDSSQEKSLSGTDKKILLKNETNFSVDISGMLKAKMPVQLKFEGPEILILHTHATESYSEEGAVSYKTSDLDRTQDTEKNIVKVGEKMAEIFRENGIETIHDKTLHDYPNYNGSYSNSLKTAQEYLQKHPSIKMIIDVHRDAIVYGDGTKAKVLTQIDGKKAAQLMFVIGTNAGGLEHPLWEKNLCTAVKLQAAIEQKYPGLMRGINLRKERFNEHLTTGSMILEVGTSGNTLSESLYSAQLAAKVIADTLKLF